LNSQNNRANLMA